MKKFIGILILYLGFISQVFAKDIRFVQISDVKYNPAVEENFTKLIKKINKEKGIKFVVFTGDNISNPLQQNLEGFIKSAKKLKKPFYIIIGEKDVNKHKNLSKKQYSKYLSKNVNSMKNKGTNYTFNSNGVMFFVVDGAKDVIPGSNGYYKDDVIEWVDANLDLYSKHNVIILQHFPLIPPTDNENLVTFKPEKYLNVINSHKNVKAVVSGHFGINSEQTNNGIVHLTTAPAPNYRVIDVIDCNSENPTIWAEVKSAD